jgi:F-type H+-transporting ATPase subunit gamma
MAGNLRDIQRRTKSVQSIKKITRAMELIAASRVVKAQQRMRESRPYASAITAALTELSNAGGIGPAHNFLKVRENRSKAAVIVVTSDRGLAGAYSSSVLRQSEELIARLRNENVEPVLYVTGRKGQAYFRFRRRPVAEQWSGFSDQPKYDDAKAVADHALEAFTNGDVDEIYIVFTDFVSALRQQPVVRRLLPLEVVETDAPVDRKPRALYEFEPDADTVLSQLLPRYIESRVFNAFLESAASELSARRQAMSTATENAGDLITEYTRQYNSARQAAITQELMEVVGASEAFSGK